MKQGKYSEEQIVKILKEADAGIKVSDLCRKYGFSDTTYYNWKAKTRLHGSQQDQETQAA
jgi:putative transposase